MQCSAVPPWGWRGHPWEGVGAADGSSIAGCTERAAAAREGAAVQVFPAAVLLPHTHCSVLCLQVPTAVLSTTARAKARAAKKAAQKEGAAGGEAGVYGDEVVEYR